MECKGKDFKFCLPERKFSLENGISWKVDQNSQTEFLNGKCARHLLVFTSFRPSGLDRLWSYLPRKSLGNGTNASQGKFPFRIWRVPFIIRFAIIYYLATGKKVHCSSGLRSLYPYTDERGILRVGGRLKHAPIPYQAKRPAILPKKHDIVPLILLHFHQRLNHSGIEHILA